jgi:hypothetical protein
MKLPLDILRLPADSRLYYMITAAVVLPVALFAASLCAISPFNRLADHAGQDQGLFAAYTCDTTGCQSAATTENLQSALQVARSTPKQKPFREGQADLTGDGTPEIIILAEGLIVVRQAGEEIWRSEPDWQVVDLALGDPNNDGRTDIIAALWKEDADGNLQSHPYIFAHRGGRVKLTWGGSAVGFPIYELILADIDGDNLQELVVLESAEAGGDRAAPLRTLSVWDWRGWHYSLRWRSEPGYYQNLRFIPATDDEEVGAGFLIVETSRL